MYGSCLMVPSARGGVRGCCCFCVRATDLQLIQVSGSCAVLMLSYNLDYG